MELLQKFDQWYIIQNQNINSVSIFLKDNMITINGQDYIYNIKKKTIVIFKDDKEFAYIENYNDRTLIYRECNNFTTLLY